jgi:hypothetical protein
MGNCGREKQWRPRKTIHLVKSFGGGGGGG